MNKLHLVVLGVALPHGASHAADRPLGVDTDIQEGGRNLSGGQKQKIALLRALVTQPAMLILDEPENNLEQGRIATSGGMIRWPFTNNENCADENKNTLE